MLRKIGPMVIIVAGVGVVATLHADTAVAPAGSAEAQVRASEILQTTTADYHAVLSMRARARSQKDVIKLNCVNDKLIQIKAEMNIADAAGQQVRLDGTESSPGFVQLQDASGSVHNLRQQAAACLGEVELSGDQLGATSSHPAFPDDPLVIPFDVYVEPPAYASPFN